MAALPQTLGELKASGYQQRSVKRELRDNARRMLAAGEPLFPGVLGYERTVIPGIINALLAEHDFILLGLRGQAKSRILRALTDFLDPEVPVLAGSELNDDPLDPISTWGQRVIAEEGDKAAVEWLPREARYNEKLATPDVSIADLLGDIDPIKAATQRSSISASSPAPIGGYSPSTSCPTSRPASRSACSISWKSEISRSAAFQSGSPWTS
jgi:magnesium chelatase subunit I